MAELNASAGASRHQGIARSKKLSTRVDLTPMVDLGFLLITFFIFTTTMSEPVVLNLNTPVDDDKKPTKFSDSKVLTVIPIDEKRVLYYHGELGKAEREGLYGFTSYSVKDGVGEIIRKKQQSLEAHPEFTRHDLQVIIRPAKECNYGNVVDVLDEMLINDVHTYAFTDLTGEEEKFLERVRKN